MALDRKKKQDVFIRICRDSGFKLDPVEAAKMTARIIDCHPFDILVAIGDVSTMRELAEGTHHASSINEPEK